METENYTEIEKVQNPSIEDLKTLGYQHIRGSDLSIDLDDGDRKTERDVVLHKVLSESLKKINPWMDDDNLDNALRTITNIQKASLLEANEYVWKLLVSHFSIEKDLGEGRKGQTVKIIDFDNLDNNVYHVVDELTVRGDGKSPIRADIVLYINGIPLVVIECKSPYISDPLEEAIYQLRRYANTREDQSEPEGAERLFYYNALMIADCRDQCHIGTITSTAKHYLPWKDTYPYKEGELGEDPTPQKIVNHCVLRPQALLDILRSFTVFEPEEGRVVKKTPRYQQYRAVLKCMNQVLTGEDRLSKGGYVWHTQGSGKSLTMVFLIQKFRNHPELKGYKLVFITDRTSLDKQLSNTMERCQDETVNRVKSVKDLKESLANNSSDIITAMLQKFQERELEEMPVLNESEKILILVDEAHRGHFKGLASNIRKALPNAPIIGFTGTPLLKDEKQNKAMGDPIDTYTIEQAVEDGATVQIMYEGRESKTKVTGDNLEKLFELYFADTPPEDRDRIISKYGREQAVLEAPKRIKEVCKDLLEHYTTKIMPDGFKAQIVVGSRRAAILYHKALNELGAPKSAVIISGSHNDDTFYTPYTDQAKQASLIEDFKKPLDQSPLAFLIVKDKLLTGFDAPIEQVMYIDRKLREHTLLQAIARVNRTKSGKDCGYIVDYYGLSDYLDEALSMFTKTDVKGAFVPLKEELPKLEARHKRVLAYFEGVKISDIDECVLKLKDDQIRAEFERDFKKFLTSMNIIVPDKMASPFIGDMKKLGKINHAARNRYRAPQLGIKDAGAKVQQMIDEHISSEGIDPKIPPVELFSPKFIQTVEQIKDPRTQACEIEYAIKSHIKINFDEDPVYYKKLSERLNEILQKHHENWEELALKLHEMREDEKTNRQKQAQDLGLSEVEYSFYNALKDGVIEQLPDKAQNVVLTAELVSLTKSLVSSLEKASSIVDFFSKRNEVKKAEREIKHTLMDAKEFDGTDTLLINKITEQFMSLVKKKMS